MKDSGPRSNDEKLSLKEVIAMGIGGMVGGGIFSVLGLAIAQAGHAAPIAFALGGIIALLTGLSYAHLGLAFQSSVSLAALFSTASAINATMFGTARLGMAMAREKALPTAFGFRRKQNNIPWVSLVAITLATLVFVNLANLTIISSFASSTFLLIFAAINLSAWRLRRKIACGPILPLLGLLLSLASWLALTVYLWKNSPDNLLWIGLIYLSVIMAELLFSQRRLVHKVH